MQAPVWRESMPGELRCTVLCHEHAWVLAALVGLTREERPAAWMQNRRALSLCAFGTRISP
jgi:hypothetical protein